MTEKRFRIVNMGLDGQFIKDNGNILTVDDVVDLLNEQHETIQDLQQYKQAVSDVLIDWSKKNLTAKELGVVIAIMHELGVME